MVIRLDFCRGAAGQTTPHGEHLSCRRNSPGVGWAEDFLPAGTSAFLLLGADFFPQYWLLSFVALIPLLHRIVRADPHRALRLGFLFGLAFFANSFLGFCLISPGIGLLKITTGTVLFTGFGWLVAWGRRRWEFNWLVVALLWIGLELAVITLGLGAGLLAGAQASHPLFQGMAALFGFLSISFLIVVLNSLLIYAFDAFAHLAAVRGTIVFEGERICDLLLTPGPAALQLCLVPENRGPPLLLL